MSLQEAAGDAFSGEVWIDRDDSDHLWAGTREWCVKQSEAPRKSGAVGKILSGLYDGLDESSLLTPEVIGAGAELLVNALGQLHRLYLRPDGERVILNDAYMTAVETMISEEDEFGECDPAPPPHTLQQVGGPLRPVAFVGPGATILAVIMPVRSSFVTTTDA